MKAGIAAAVLVLAAAGAALLRRRQPQMVPLELAGGIMILEMDGWSVPLLHPRWCPGSRPDDPHVHLASPGGKPFIIYASGRMRIPPEAAAAMGINHV